MTERTVSRVSTESRAAQAMPAGVGARPEAVCAEYHTAPITWEEREIGRRLQMPETALRLIDFFLTPQDQAFLLDYPGEAVGIEEIGQSYAVDAFDRGVLVRVRRGNTPAPEQALPQDFDYAPGTFYGILDVFCVREAERYYTLPVRIRQRLDSWYFERYLMRLHPGPQGRAALTVLTLQEALEVIRKTEVPLYLSRCEGRCPDGAWESTGCSCISFARAQSSSVIRRIARRITPEQAQDILVEADRAGLVHLLGDHGICSCSAQDCRLLQAQRAGR